MRRTIITMALNLCLMTVVARAQANPSVINPRTGQTYSGIQWAVDAAAPGDTLMVGQGQYFETVVITKSITLVGNRGQAPLITPASGSPAIWVINPPRGSEITIKNLNMVVSNSNAVQAEVAAFNLMQNIITGSGSNTAISTYIPAAVVLDGNVIQEFQTGLEVDGVPGVQVTNNRFKNMVDSVYLSECPGAIIQNNQMRNISDEHRFYAAVAIGLQDSPNTLVAGNLVCNHHMGVLINGGDDSVVRDNVMNDDLDTEGDGILISWSARVQVIGNRIEDFDYAMDFILSRDNYVTQNWMAGAEEGIVNQQELDPRYVVDARGNWWGAADGPSFAGPGHGISVGPNILFDPWLVTTPQLSNNWTCSQP